MLTMNRATLVGHAGRNPEMRTLPSGGEVALFSLATNERFKRRDGTEGESTEWHAIVAFGNAAQTVRKLVHRGAAVLVEGRIATRTWTDRSGTEHRTPEILVAGPQARVNVLTKRMPEPGGDAPSGGAAAAAVPEGTGAVAPAADRPADAGSGEAAVPAGASGDGAAEAAGHAEGAASGGAGSEAAAAAGTHAGLVDETSVPTEKETEGLAAAVEGSASASASDAGKGGDAVPPEDANAAPGADGIGAAETGGDGSDNGAGTSTGGDARVAASAGTAAARAESDAAGNEEAVPSGREAGGTAACGGKQDTGSAGGKAGRFDSADHG